MSGIKYAEIEAQRERAALRRAAEERARQELDAAQAELTATIEETSARLIAIEREGFAVLAPVLKAELHEARARSSATSSEELRARAARLQRATELVVRFAVLLGHLPERMAHTRETMLGSIRGATDFGRLEQAFAGWLHSDTALAAVEGFLREYQRAAALVAACDIAGVPLDDHQVRTIRAASEFAAAPDPAHAGAAQTRLARLNGANLNAGLQRRRDALLALLDELAEPHWFDRLQAWRAGFEADMARLKTIVTADDWSAGAPLLAELDAFLGARARERVEILRDGGRAAGLVVGPLVFDPERRAWGSQLSDDHGPLVQIAELCVDWRSYAVDERVELRGPHEWDGPACAAGGYDKLVDALRGQGVSVRLYTGANVELLPLPVDVSTQPDASPRRSSRRLVDESA